MLKILLAALLGGIVMFLWDGLSHEVLPLGEAGVQGLHNEAAIVAVLKENVKQRGIYIFPGGEMFQPGLTSAQKQEAMKKAEAQFKAGPAGIMVVNPGGIDTSATMFVSQCVFDILAMLVAVILLAKASALRGYGARVLFITAIGLVPTLNAELPYWNWYGFPTTFIVAQGVGHLAAFLFGGLVAAALVKPAKVY
jgi:hypothetical protein